MVPGKDGLELETVIQFGSHGFGYAGTFAKDCGTLRVLASIANVDVSRGK